MIRYDSEQNPFWIPEKQRVRLRAGLSCNIFLLKFSLIFVSENIAKQCAVRSWQMLFSNSALLPNSWSTYPPEEQGFSISSLLLFLLSNKTTLGNSILTMQHKHTISTLFKSMATVIICSYWSPSLTAYCMKNVSSHFCICTLEQQVSHRGSP